MSLSSNSNNPSPQPAVSEEELSQILDSLRGLRFGSVQITIQDGVVVQIDRTEKQRLRLGKRGLN